MALDSTQSGELYTKDKVLGTSDNTQNSFLLISKITKGIQYQLFQTPAQMAPLHYDELLDPEIQLSQYKKSIRKQVNGFQPLVGFEGKSSQYHIFLCPCLQKNKKEPEFLQLSNMTLTDRQSLRFVIRVTLSGDEQRNYTIIAQRV